MVGSRKAMVCRQACLPVLRRPRYNGQWSVPCNFDLKEIKMLSSFYKMKFITYKSRHFFSFLFPTSYTCRKIKFNRKISQQYFVQVDSPIGENGQTATGRNVKENVYTILTTSVLNDEGINSIFSLFYSFCQQIPQPTLLQTSFSES